MCFLRSLCRGQRRVEGEGGGLCIHPQVIVTVEGSMRIVTMEPQGKQIPFSSSVGLLAVRDRPTAKLRGRMRKFRLPVARNSSGIMCSAASLPPSGGPECRLLTGTWLWSPGAHLVHVVLTFSLKSTDGLEIPLEKNCSVIQKTQKKKIEPRGILTFPPEIPSVLLVRLLNRGMPRNGMKRSRDAAEGLNGAALDRFSSQDIM